VIFVTNEWHWSSIAVSDLRSPDMLYFETTFTTGDNQDFIAVSSSDWFEVRMVTNHKIEVKVASCAQRTERGIRIVVLGELCEERYAPKVAVINITQSVAK
jgi:hypothetical protein